MSGGCSSGRSIAWPGWRVPDWQKLVRARLGTLGLEPEREQEIVAELAGHLEDLYEDCCASGVPVDLAFRRAVDDVSDWNRLSRKIRHVKAEEEPMNDRTKSLWLPGFATLTLSMSLLRLLIGAGLRPHIVWISSKVPLLFYVPWLLALPLMGALGAYWSRRAGGGLTARILAGLFPAACLITMFFVLVPVGLVGDRRIPLEVVLQVFARPDLNLLHVVVDRRVPLEAMLQAFASSALGWVVVPGAALLAGALPFFKDGPRRSSHAGA